MGAENHPGALECKRSTPTSVEPGAVDAATQRIVRVAVAPWPRYASRSSTGRRTTSSTSTHARASRATPRRSRPGSATAAAASARTAWEGRRIPVAADGEVVERPLEVDGRRWAVTCVSMGNPHCVVFVDDDVAGLALADLGPRFARHPFFPRGVNTEFVRPLGPERLEMRVWERGAGETMACGTGACAAAVAAARTGRSGRRVVVALPGGELEIDWRPDDRVLMTGDAVEVFEGQVEV